MCSSDLHEGRLVRWAVRLYGVNTPEIRGVGDEEKKKGLDARDWVRERVLDKIVWIECYKFEKYGRLLCDVYLDDSFEGPTLSDMIITEGLGVPFMRTVKK